MTTTEIMIAAMEDKINEQNTKYEALKSASDKLAKALEFYSDKKDWFQVIASDNFGSTIQDGDIFIGFEKGEDSPWYIAVEALAAYRAEIESSK